MIEHALAFLRRDARHFQILFLSAFLCYGLFGLQWDADLFRFVLLLGTVLVTQAFFIHWKGLPWNAMKSALITGLGLCLLFHAGHWTTLVIVGVVAIAGKFLLRFRGKHIFNPANLGIVVGVLVLGDGWVSPGQWGTAPITVFLIGAAGAMVLLRAGRLDTSLAFLITYAALDYCRMVLHLGWGPEVWAHRMMNGSLLLFAFFMITDPRTTPNAPLARVLWSALIALLAFVMGQFAYIHTAPLWALFLISSATPLLDILFKGEAFRWLPKATQIQTTPFHKDHEIAPAR